MLQGKWTSTRKSCNKLKNKHKKADHLQRTTINNLGLQYHQNTVIKIQLYYYVQCRWTDIFDICLNEDHYDFILFRPNLLNESGFGFSLRNYILYTMGLVLCIYSEQKKQQQQNAL